MIGPNVLREVFRFGVVGVAASAAHIAVALLLIEHAGLPVLWANALAFSVALSISYLGNHRWTFRRTGAHERHFPRFLATALLGLGLNQLIILLTVELAGWPYLAGILLVVLLVPALSFALSKGWAFAWTGARSRVTQARNDLPERC